MTVIQLIAAIGLGFVVVLLVLWGIADWVLSSRRDRREQEQHEYVLQAIARGDRADVFDITREAFVEMARRAEERRS